MVRHGSITEQHLKDASVFAKKGKRLGDVLVELNIIKAEELESCIRVQLLEVTSNVMIQPPKKMAFKRTTDVIQVIAEPVAILDIIMEAARRTPSIDNHLKTLLRDDRHLTLTKDSFGLMERVSISPSQMVSFLPPGAQRCWP